MPSYRLLGGNRIRLTHLHTICDALFMRRSSSLICRSRAPLSALTLTSGWPGNGRREEPQRSLIPSGCPRHMPPKHLQTWSRRRCRGLHSWNISLSIFHFKLLNSYFYSTSAYCVLFCQRSQSLLPRKLRRTVCWFEIFIKADIDFKQGDVSDHREDISLSLIELIENVVF